MVRQMDADTRSGPRYLAAFEVRAEWDEPGGSHVVVEGTTENVGPEGTLVLSEPRVVKSSPLILLSQRIAVAALVHGAI